VTVVCADELGPVIPRSFPPAPGWSTDGHRSKAPLEYSRGMEKTWVHGALRPGDGQAVTLAAPSRNSIGDQQLLAAVEQANPTGEIAAITDNLSSHSSFSTRIWLATQVATCQLNARARPWVWGRPAPSPRYRRRVLTYRI
jgi:DDE superfamily endonuclease